jgi:hypothetical protein
MYKLKQEGLFGDLGKMQGLFDVVKKDVVLDSQWNVLDFAQQVPNLTGGNVVFNTLPIQGFATRNGESVNLVDEQQIQRIMQRLIAVDPSPAPAASTTAPAPAAPAPQQPASVAPATVDVLNGSGVTGLAAQKQKDLVDAGWTAGRTGNAMARAHTVVRYGAGATAAAKQVAAKLGVSAVPTASPNVAAGHVEVLLGADVAGSATPSGGSTAAEPASSIPFQGSAVEMGKGIPCVD